jgi:uncharacterized protein YoxC
MVSNTQGNDSPTDNTESCDKNELVSRIERLEQVVNEQSETIEELTEEKDELREDVEKLTEEKDELREDVEKLTEEKDELREDVEKLTEEKDELEGQNHDLEQTVQSQQDEIDELRSELIEHQERSVRKIAETMKDVNQIQESLEGDSEGITPTPNDGKTTIQEHDLTPIEQISRAENENLDQVIDSPSVRRAVSLFKNIMDWGNRTLKGIVLKSSDNPLSLLSADMDESLCWKQYYRACETLESLSEGALTFVSDSRHGKMLILHEKSEVYQRMMNGSLSMSSVGTTV